LPCHGCISEQEAIVVSITPRGTPSRWGARQGFAGLSAWLVAPIGQSEARQRYAASASGLAVMSVLVLVLKLAGPAVALAAVRVRPGRPHRLLQLLGVVVWGAFGLLACARPGTW
jgi:hypothetical protein